MINPQLLNYVRAQRSAGVPKEEIIKALSGGGWSAQDAQEAFAAIEGVQVPPIAPKPMPPPAPVATPAPQPRPIQPVAPVMQQPVQPVTPPMTARVQPQPTVQRQPVYAPVVAKSHAGLWMFFLIFFLILGFVGGAYAAVAVPAIGDAARDFKNLIMPPTLEPVMEETTQNTNPLPFEPFAPAPSPLGSGTASSTVGSSASATSTASTTPRN